jgi:hypothetical protein
MNKIGSRKKKSARIGSQIDGAEDTSDSDVNRER